MVALVHPENFSLISDCIGISRRPPCSTPPDLGTEGLWVKVAAFDEGPGVHIGILGSQKVNV